MDLVNIAPATKTVALGSATVEVTGLSLRKCTLLIVSYPDVATLVLGGNIDIGTLIATAPEAALAIFSLGVVGRPRSWRRPAALIAEEDFCPAFDMAPAGQQIEIISTIYDLTIKGGERAVPFLRSLLSAPKTEGGSPSVASSTSPNPESPPASAEPTPDTSINSKPPDIPTPGS